MSTKKTRKKKRGGKATSRRRKPTKKKIIVPRTKVKRTKRPSKKTWVGMWGSPQPKRRRPVPTKGKAKLPIWLRLNEQQLEQLPKHKLRKLSSYERRMIAARLSYPTASPSQWAGRPVEGESPLWVISALRRSTVLPKSHPTRLALQRKLAALPETKHHTEIIDGRRRFVLDDTQAFYNLCDAAGVDSNSAFTVMVSP